jgi:tetratricopeptide (TPR) repeat protein
MNDERFIQQESEEHLRKRIAATSANPKDYRELGTLLFLSGSFDEGVLLYEQAITLSSTNLQKVEAQIELGWAFYEIGDQTTAQTFAESAVRLLSYEGDSHDVLAWRGAAQSLLVHCALSKNAHSDKKLILAALETLERVTGESPKFEGKKTAYYDEARLHLLSGNVDKAMVLCEKFLQCELNELEGISGLMVYGDALCAAKRFGEAEQTIKEALRYAKKYKSLVAYFYSELGRIQWHMKRLPDAQEAFQNALFGLTADPYRNRKERLLKDICMSLAGVYYELGNLREAAATYQEVVESTMESDPDHGEAQLWLGRCHEGMGGYADARACFEKVVVLPTPSEDDKLSARGGIARSLHHVREYRKALIVYRDLLSSYPEHDPRLANTINWLGDCYQGLGDYAKARESYEKVLASPTASEDEKLDARVGIARGLYRVREYWKALIMYGDLLSSYPEHDPRLASTINWLGHCHEGLGDYDKARESYEEVLSSPHALAKDKTSAQEGLQRLPPNRRQTTH